MPTPKVGQVIDGMYFRGGNPNNPNSWTKAIPVGTVSQGYVYKGGDPKSGKSFYKIDQYNMKGKKPNWLQSLIVGAGQGLTFNTMDEGAGKAAVRNFQVSKQGDAVKNLARGQFRNALADINIGYGKTGKQARNAIRSNAISDARNYINAAQEKHPSGFYGGTLAGALVPTSRIGQTAKGASLGVRAARSALEGGIQGALYGAGEATEGNRIAGATTGAVLGGAVGGAIPAVGSGVRKVSRAVPVFRATPQQKTGEIIMKATKGKPQTLKAEIERLKKAGVPNPTLADANYKLARQAGSFARRDNGGKARELAASRATDMLNEVPSAASNMVRKTTKQPHTQEQAKAANTQYRKSVQNWLMEGSDDMRAPLTMAARSKMGTQVLKRSMQGVADDIRLRNIEDTPNPLDALVIENAINPRNIKLNDPYSPAGNTYSLPNDVSLRTVDNLRKSFDPLIEKAMSEGGDVGALIDARNMIVDPARGMYPQYNTALDLGNMIHTKNSAMEDAYSNFGKEFAADIGDKLSQMTPQQTSGYQTGAANNITRSFLDDRNNFDTLRRMAAGQDFTNKLGTVFGQDAAQNMQQGAAALNQRVSAARAINPNFGSQTAENLANDQIKMSGGIKSQLANAVSEWLSKVTDITPEQKLHYIDSVTRNWGDSNIDEMLEFYSQTGFIPDWLPILMRNTARNQGVQYMGRQ